MKKTKKLIELPKLKQDVIKYIYTSYNKYNGLVDTILERKRKEMLIEKENEEYLKELKDKL
mgnify:FL=1|jgi:hypothetical protein|tara:strand:+ start:508 stop:690 length:183 start_codon:yes stop_codon:yes gene_type:complete